MAIKFNYRSFHCVCFSCYRKLNIIGECKCPIERIPDIRSFWNGKYYKNLFMDEYGNVFPGED